MNQNRLPFEFKDSSMLELMRHEMDIIDQRKNAVVSGETFNDLVLVLCGRHIQYAKIKNLDVDIMEASEFKHASLEFKEDIEIFNLRSTSKADII